MDRLAHRVAIHLCVQYSVSLLTPWCNHIAAYSVRIQECRHLLIRRITAALPLPYAKPPRTLLLNLEIPPVAMTWLRCTMFEG